MRVLQIANGYLDTKLYANLFDHLERIGIENRVYVPISMGAADPGPQPANVHISRCFTQLDRVRFYSKQAHMLSDIMGGGLLDGVDMVHAHTVFSGGYAAYQLYRQRGLSYVVAVRNTDINDFFPYMIHLRSTGVEILKHAGRVIFLSPRYRDKLMNTYVPPELRGLILAKSVVIPNGIHPYFLENRGAPRKAPHTPLQLIYVGGVDGNKNLKTTLEAVKLLRERGVACEITVVGRIVDERYRPLLARTNYLGPRDMEGVCQALRQADIFVMPSHKETFGLVYAEAMSQGLPVIYTRGQGFDGQFPDGEVGYAVSDRSAREIADRVQDVVKHYPALSSRCIQLAGKFDWPAIAGQYRDVYAGMKGSVTEELAQSKRTP